MLLIEGVHIGLAQPHPGLFRFPVRFQLLGAAGVRRQPHTALGGFFQPVGAFHPHIFLFCLLDFSVGLDGNRIERRGLDCMGQLGRGRGFVHVLKPQAGLGFACGGVCYLPLYQLFLFGDLGLGRIRLIRRFVRPPDVLLQTGILAFGIGKL